MPNISELVTAGEIARVWNEKAQERKPYLGEALFPAKKQLGLRMKSIKGGAQPIRILNLAAFDTKAIPLEREGFETISEKMPFFKNSLNVDEELRQQLNQVADDNTGVINAIVDEIMDDQTTLLNNADATREYMRMKALTTGEIHFGNNGVSVAVNYNIPEDNKVTLDAGKWSDAANADPISDINDLISKITAAGYDAPNAILMNSVTFGLMRKTEALKNAIYVFGNGKVVPNANAAKEYIQGETGCTIYVYDKGMNINKKFEKFVPDNCVVVFNAQNVGKTTFGTTPEESDLTAGLTAKVAIVDTGVAITQYTENDPVVSTTKVSMICLPSLEGANSIGIITVA